MGGWGLWRAGAALRWADGELLSAETLAAIEEGLEDIESGRTVSWDQIKRESGL